MSVSSIAQNTIHQPPIARELESQLLANLRRIQSVIVAYSGGVDSTYLAWAANEALGPRALIVTAQSPSMAESEFVFASTLARERGWNFRIIETRETEDPRWTVNDRNRCYFCKTELFDVIDKIAQEENYERVLYGAIPEDLGDVRPGQTAATEHRVAAPLIDVGMGKDAIRDRSRIHRLPSWNKPQMACLASRFPIGTEITNQKLRQVDRAEAALLALGFVGHRVRHHGDLARIELQNNDWPRIGDDTLRERMVVSVKEAGYKHVTIDLSGYRPAGEN